MNILKICHYFPRLIHNSFKHIQPIQLTDIKSKLKDDISLSYYFINSVTALTAELEGRSYGGGVLELKRLKIEDLNKKTKKK